jgi:heterodisulfide reductase subunit B
MTSYAFFEGCKIPYFLKEYGSSSRALLGEFGACFVDLEFNCCGYPVRDIDFPSFIFSGARNLALAEVKGAHIVTPCQCCYGSLKFVESYLRRDNKNLDKINELLGREGLQWLGGIEIKHILTVLHDDIGLETLRSSVVHPLKGLKVAAHTGCHALRPGGVTQFDNPLVPVVLNDLVAVTGAQSVYWPMSTECCGNPQWDKNRALSLKQTRRKLASAGRAGADCVCSACTYCQLQFERNRSSTSAGANEPDRLPSILVSQLIGRSVGLDENLLGINKGLITNK